MTPLTPPRRGASTVFGRLLTLTFTVALAGCEDDATHPFAELVAEESAGALALGIELPDPAQWAMPSSVSSESASAVAGWISSWDLPEDEGRAARRGSYEVLAAVFADELARGGIAEQADRLAEGVRRARALPREQLPERIGGRIAEAGSEHAAAMDALRSDNADEALVYILRGSDALREVGPEAVARTLVSEAEVSYRRVSEDDAYSEEDLERLDRLVRGARQAVREADWVRAIRRAYYAKGLLAGGGA